MTKGVGLGAPVLKIGVCNRSWVVVPACFSERYKLLRVGIRQGTKKKGIDDAKYCRVCAES